MYRISAIESEINVHENMITESLLIADFDYTKQTGNETLLVGMI